MEFPADLKYTESDEWVRVKDGQAELGISDYAQDALSDVVFFEGLVAEGDEVSKGDSVATVESVKAAADVYTPVSGTVVAVNEDLADAPERINTDPYGGAWMIRIELSDPSELEALMDAEAYETHTEEKEH